MDLSESLAARNAPSDPACAVIYWRGKYEAMRERGLGLAMLLVMQTIAPEDAVPELKDQMKSLFDND